MRDAERRAEPLDEVLDARGGAVGHALPAPLALHVHRRGEEARRDDEPAEHDARREDHDAEPHRAEEGQARDTRPPKTTIATSGSSGTRTATRRFLARSAWVTPYSEAHVDASA